MSGQIFELENELTILWEQLAQVMQKALKHHNILRYVRNADNVRRPIYLTPTVHFGDVQFTVEQEAQRKFIVL